MFAYLAVNGYRNGPTAAGTGSITNSWWAVDLGRITYVGNVTITLDPNGRKLAELQAFRVVCCFATILNLNRFLRQILVTALIELNCLARINWKIFL